MVFVLVHFDIKSYSVILYVSLRWPAWGRCGAPDLTWGQGQSGVFDPDRGGRRCQAAAGRKKSQCQRLWKRKLCRTYHPSRCYGKILFGRYLSPESRDFTFTHMQSAPHQQDHQPRLKEKLNILCYLLNLCAPLPFQLSVRVFYCIMLFIYSHAF